LRAGIDEAGGSLRPWLLGIALNVTRNLNRAARRHQAAMSRLPAAPTVPDFAEDLIGQLDDAGELRRVLAALDQLKPGERDVLVLCVWSGLDYAAAAQALGVPVGTVRSRLSRARDKLRPRSGPLLADIKAAIGKSRATNMRVMRLIGDVLINSIAPPKFTAALYRVAANIPGVHVVTHATDPLGRPGIGITFSSGGTRIDWIFNSKTLHLSGERITFVNHSKKDQQYAVRTRAFVNHSA